MNQRVKQGHLAHPNTLPCADCGHVWTEGSRHTYDHHLGYGAAHQYDVEAVCSFCHVQRSIARGEFKPLNWTGRKRPNQNDNRARRANGTFEKGVRRG